MEVKVYSLSHYSESKAKRLEQVMEHVKSTSRVKVNKIAYADYVQYNWFGFCAENGIPFLDNSCPAIMFRANKDDKWQLLGTGVSSLEKLKQLGEAYGN